MEIEIGEYIRTYGGTIDKIENHKRHSNQYICKKNIIIGNEDIAKHSKNIIDLLEDEDIVEIEYYVPKYGRRITRKFEYVKISDCFLDFENAHCLFTYNIKEKKWTNGKGFNPKIKAILTKEQYENHCFKVGE